MQKQKNRYYHGKMLRSDDFICEQTYMLDQMKARTHAALGEGILYGLHLSRQSDERLHISSGSALDSTGNFIQLEEDVTMTLEELEGFSQINTDAGWITLHHREEAVGKEFCELPSTHQHEEYGKWEDRWELHIQEQQPPDYLDEQIFKQQVIYEDTKYKLYLHIPCMLPQNGDVELLLQVEQKQEAPLHLALTLRSTLYHIQTVELHTKDKKKEHSIPVLLKRNHTAGAHYVVFHIDQLQLEQHSVTIPEQAFEIEMVEDMKASLVKRLMEKPFVFQNELILGYVEFKCEHDRLHIQKVNETGRIECQRPQLDMVVEELKRRLRWTDKKESHIPADHQNVKEACGILHFQCDRLHPVFYSDEISHGLGPGEIQMQISIEIQSPQDAPGYQKQLISGDSSLFQTEETLRWAVRCYPWTGSFQAAVSVSESYYEQKLIAHWYARAWDMQTQNVTETRLLRLEPSTIACRPQDVCHFTAVFDREEDIRELRFSLDDASAGELQEDGTFTAGQKSGMYQIRAHYHDQQVAAYVKVMEAHE